MGIDIGGDVHHWRVGPELEGHARLTRHGIEHLRCLQTRGKHVKGYNEFRVLFVLLLKNVATNYNLNEFLVLKLMDNLKSLAAV